MERRDDELSFGVFKPVGHVVIAFPRPEEAAAAARAFADLGLEGGTSAVRSFDDRQMIEQIDRDIERASPLAAIGQELNLVRAHRALAERGHHFLVVHAPDARQAAQVAEIARVHGAERAQFYGNFIIEELIEPPYGMPQVSESPDRGLDAQTPTGLEGEGGEDLKDASRLDDRAERHGHADCLPRTSIDPRKERLMNTLATSNNVISSRRVEGTAVYNTSGEKLGSIDDLMIDKQSGHVRYAVLEFGGFLGIGTDRYPLPWGMLKYDTSKDGYVVALDKATLEKAPRYRKSEVPDYTDDYGRKVYDYYGAAWY